MGTLHIYRPVTYQVEPSKGARGKDHVKVQVMSRKIERKLPGNFLSITLSAQTGDEVLAVNLRPWFCFLDCEARLAASESALPNSARSMSSSSSSSSSSKESDDDISLLHSSFESDTEDADEETALSDWLFKPSPFTDFWILRALQLS